jgi:nitrate reductase assembly molybdenum cofactor insertion protein NarJ
MKLDHYASFAKVFEYPGEDYHEVVIEAIKSLGQDYPDSTKELEKFLELLPMQSGELQELYSKSFEVQAITSLDVGYVLYGDDYQRGVIMVNLKDEHSKADNSCGEELVDFLPNLLRLLPKMQDPETIHELVTLLIATAVEKMMDEYNVSALKAKDALYQKQHKTLITPTLPIIIFLHAFKALYSAFDSDFVLIKTNKLFKDESFIGHIRSELEVQEGKQSSNSCDTGGCSTSSC